MSNLLAAPAAVNPFASASFTLRPVSDAQFEANVARLTNICVPTYGREGRRVPLDNVPALRGRSVTARVAMEVWSVLAAHRRLDWSLTTAVPTEFLMRYDDRGRLRPKSKIAWPSRATIRREIAERFGVEQTERRVRQALSLLYKLGLVEHERLRRKRGDGRYSELVVRTILGALRLEGGAWTIVEVPSHVGEKLAVVKGWGGAREGAGRNSTRVKREIQMGEAQQKPSNSSRATTTPPFHRTWKSSRAAEGSPPTTSSPEFLSATQRETAALARGGAARAFVSGVGLTTTQAVAAPSTARPPAATAGATVERAGPPPAFDFAAWLTSPEGARCERAAALLPRGARRDLLLLVRGHPGVLTTVDLVARSGLLREGALGAIALLADDGFLERDPTSGTWREASPIPAWSGKATAEVTK